MKILHVLPSLAPGGMERLAVQLGSDATAHGDSAVVASGPGAWVDKAAAAGAEHVALPATSRSAVADMASAIALLGRGMGRLRPPWCILIMSGRQSWPGSRCSPHTTGPRWYRRCTGSSPGEYTCGEPGI